MTAGASRPPAVRDGRGRPLLEPLLRGLLRHVVEAAPEALGHVAVDQIIIVAGAARRGARASIRPLSFGPAGLEAADGRRKPQIRLRGRAMAYELCLRPLYFLRTSPEERLRILVHELWHVAPSFDGTLDPTRRHTEANRADSAAFAEAVARAAEPGADLRVLRFEGELRAPMWLERPPSLLPDGAVARERYDERDLFLGVVRQRSAPSPGATGPD